MGKDTLTGDRTPAYPRKSTLAAELDMSETTVDSYVKRGILPPPIRCGGSIRWCWADVQAHLGRNGSGGDDPFAKGLDNV